MYQQAQQQNPNMDGAGPDMGGQAGAGPDMGGTDQQQSQNTTPGGDDVVDADYTVVDDDKKDENK
jgi:molecular chaperone DnaK